MVSMNRRDLLKLGLLTFTVLPLRPLAAAAARVVPVVAPPEQLMVRLYGGMTSWARDLLLEHPIEVTRREGSVLAGPGVEVRYDATRALYITDVTIEIPADLRAFGLPAEYSFPNLNTPKSLLNADSCTVLFGEKLWEIS